MPAFHATRHAFQAKSLTDGVALSDKVILPWMAFGTYKLTDPETVTLQAFRAGYRGIDTAFCYGGEKTEKAVGRAIHTAIESGLVKRNELCVVTKQWRKYHGYEATKKCFAMSLKRLQLDYIDIYLIHWPGPAHSTMNRRKDVIETDGPWAYATTTAKDLPKLRAETWRAMEDLYKEGKIRAIGVSNFTVAHLETLKTTAKVWPPAVNQVECHPLFPNNELREYCQQEGIVLQAYAVLGGQDGSKRKWGEINDGESLLECQTVTDMAAQEKGDRTPGQVLIRYALQRDCAVVVKASTSGRLEENAQALTSKELSKEEMSSLDALDRGPDGRLCWAREPLRNLEFD